VSEQDQALPPPEPRISTGTEALDVMLHGGFMTKRPYLVVGSAGTGKTTLALQFLCEGIRRGERCLIVTLEEPPNEMRMNHRSMLPDLDQVYVFDAIPDVMRYERAPFKDIAAVRQAVPFSQVPMQIRKTPELSSVEVTFTALEQTLKMEMARRHFQRIVIDSLTALQYFCMKGFDETLGAQTFLRFLSDLQVTTVLTVEAPLEDSETPERLLARGEIRLFRWEHDTRTVRAIGVEKFRGSEHDGRLHPYRISPRGLDINLALTISRDNQELLPSTIEVQLDRKEPREPPEIFATSLESLEQDSRDLIGVGVDVAGIRSTVLEALAASERSTPEDVARIIARARGRVLEIVSRLGETAPPDGAEQEIPEMRRLRARLAAARMGIPPSGPPDLATLRPMLEKVLDALEPADRSPRSPAAPGPRPAEGAPLVAPPPADVASPSQLTPVAQPSIAVRRPGSITDIGSPKPSLAPPASSPAPAARDPTPDASAIEPAEVSPPVPPPVPAPAALPTPPMRSTPEPAIPPPGAGHPVPSRAPPAPPGVRPQAGATVTPSPAQRAATSKSPRAMPPPLPSPGMPEAPRPPPPISVARAERARVGPRPEPTPVVSAPADSVVPAAPAAPAGAPPKDATSPPKRRRKATESATPSVPRKRTPRTSKIAQATTPVTLAPDAVVPPPASPDESVPPVAPPGPLAEPDASVPPTTKPKRRAPRRKAPPVTAAEAGSPPPDEARVSDADSKSVPPSPGSSADDSSTSDGG
jgi:KaiC/GvpD/RAD55 family RecA-like ATPase